MWVVKEESRKIDLEIYTKMEKVFLLELSFSLPGETDAGSFKKYTKAKPL